MNIDRVVGGKYRINGLLGVGSMAEVYAGTHIEIGKRVAIKILTSVRSRSPDIVARFRREARAAACLESEYVVQVFDVGCDDRLGLYLVTEALVGEDLEKRLRRERVVDAATAATLGYQVARGSGEGARRRHRSS
jgi:serine/threonine-protein kinase